MFLCILFSHSFVNKLGILLCHSMVSSILPFIICTLFLSFNKMTHLLLQIALWHHFPFDKQRSVTNLKLKGSWCDHANKQQNPNEKCLGENPLWSRFWWEGNGNLNWASLSTTGLSRAPENRKDGVALRPGKWLQQDRPKLHTEIYSLIMSSVHRLYREILQHGQSVWWLTRTVGIIFMGLTFHWRL